MTVEKIIMGMTPFKAPNRLLSLFIHRCLSSFNYSSSCDYRASYKNSRHLGLGLDRSRLFSSGAYACFSQVIGNLIGTKWFFLIVSISSKYFEFWFMLFFQLQVPMLKKSEISKWFSMFIYFILLIAVYLFQFAWFKIILTKFLRTRVQEFKPCLHQSTP